MTTQLPERIDITFTEDDRQNAASFSDNENCLVATALKRMGYNHNANIWVTPYDVRIGSIYYNPENRDSLMAGGLHNDPTRRWNNPPHYRPGIVGKTITLIKE